MDAGRPTVSIVVTSYNHAAEVGAAIDSALAQTYPCEVIVVEDGSPDNSAEVVASYGGSVQAIYQENAGQPAAMNTGFFASSGDLVFFLDSDDLLYPAAVETLVEHHDPAASTYMWFLDIIDQEGTPTGQRIPGPDPQEGNLRDLVLRRGPGARYSPPTSGMAWTRDFLEEALPLPTVLRAWPDSLLVDVAPLYGKVVAVHRHLGAFRVHSGSTSHQAKGLTETNLDRVRLLNDVRIAHLARHAGMDKATWLSTNWRQQTVRTLLGKIRRNEQPTVTAMARAGWAADGSFVKRSLLAGLAVSFRLLPLPAARALAAHTIYLEYM